MQIETNPHGDRIDYECPSADLLTKYEKEYYWSACEKAEKAIYTIWLIQQCRVEERHPSNAIVRDIGRDSRELREAMENLDDALTQLRLIEKSAKLAERLEEDEKDSVVDDE